jgi:hypothetical protein
MPKWTAEEQEATYEEIRKKFREGATLTALRAEYPGKFTIGELKQIVQQQTKSTDPGDANASSNIAPKKIRKAR